MSGLSKYLLSAQISSSVQTWEWEKESRRDCTIFPGRTELRKRGWYGWGREDVVSIMCIYRIENRGNEKTGMWMLLGGRSELQRSSCSGVWPSG